MNKPSHSVTLWNALTPAQEEAVNAWGAEKVRADQWTGVAVWSEEGGRVFTTIDSLRQWYAHNSLSLPAYVWECEKEEANIEASARIAIDSIAAHINEISYDASEDLIERLEDWLEAHDIRLLRWIKGSKRVVIL